MKYTLLKMTQLILSSMDSSEVNDIDDNAESKSVVDIIETVYNEFSSDYNFPEHKDLYQLNATSSTTPTVLTRPSNAVTMEWLKYDNKLSTETNTDYVEIKELPIHEFIRRMDALDADQSDIEQFTFTSDNGETYVFTVYNTRFPDFYMVLNDKNIICDGYKSTEETNLQKSNTMCFGQLEYTFTRSNTFTPNFDESVFSAFFNECKSQCFNDLKLSLNAKTEKKSRQGQVRIQKNKHDFSFKDYRDTSPNYGRK